ncbi:MAG: response regulator [Fidelibacterota bacterium]
MKTKKMNFPSKDRPHPDLLVVEDNEANMKFLLFILQRFNLSFQKAYSGEEAVDIIENQDFSGMLFDINLGEGISGIELMQKVRKKERFSETPIIAVTAYFGDNFEEELLKKGFSDYLGKPYVLDQLKKILNKNRIL